MSPSSPDRMAVASGPAACAGAAEPQAYAFGPFRLAPGERALCRGDRALPLPPKAFDTLLLLVRNSGHLMRKEDLMKALWPDSFVEEVNLANKISLLRRVLENAGAAGVYIQTVPKLGYRFVPAVTRVWASGAVVGTSIPAGREAPGERVIRFIALPPPGSEGAVKDIRAWPALRRAAAWRRRPVPEA